MDEGNPLRSVRRTSGICKTWEDHRLCRANIGATVYGSAIWLQHGTRKAISNACAQVLGFTLRFVLAEVAEVSDRGLLTLTGLLWYE